MKTKTIFAALIAMPMLLGATGESFAWSKSFKGARDQVRAACDNVGGVLIEGDVNGIGYSTCNNDSKGTVATCDDQGDCWGSGPGPMPRVRTGMIDLGTLLSTKAKTYQVPESLVSGGGDGSSGATGGAGSAGVEMGQWHAQQGGGPIFYAN